MKDKLLTSLFAAVFVTLASTAMATTTWYVNGVNGSDSNNCKTRLHACKTIGHAISLASSGDSIMAAAAAYQEHLTIGVNLKILGSGAATTIISGGGNGRVVTISSAQVTLSKLRIINGVASYGGGVLNDGELTIANCVVDGNLANKANGYRGGGGISNYGTLTINNSTISSNQAYGHYGSVGGGIFSSGALTINRSTISGNRTHVISAGGGIYFMGTTMINNSTISRNASSIGGGIFTHGGTLTVTNSTFSENSALNGGGIYNGGTLAVTNSTFSGNTAVDEEGGGITNTNSGTLAVSNSTFGGNSASNGGGIYNNVGAVTIQNSIVANSPSGGNCGGTIPSTGYNLSSDNTCAFTNVGDLNNTDPMLGKLGNHGGPTQTMALPSGSPAVDAGNPHGCSDNLGHLLKIDQRGKPRPDTEDNGVGCDMGAYERQSD